MFLGLHQFSSVTQLCSILCDTMDCSTPGIPVHHQLLELAQTHVHRVGDAIQPSHPLTSPSLPIFNLAQNQGLFELVRPAGAKRKNGAWRDPAAGRDRTAAAGPT